MSLTSSRRSASWGFSRAVEGLESRTLFAGGIPAVSVSSHAHFEPVAGDSPISFAVTLDEPAPDVIRLNYATADGGARAGSDYTKTLGTLTFQPGESTKAVLVPVRSDALVEGDETLYLNLSVFTGTATFADDQGAATVCANSGLAAASSTALPLGGGGVVTFAGARGKPVRVSLNGPGAGAVSLRDGGGAVITLTGTTPDSRLTIAGRTVLHSLNVQGSLGRLTAPGTDLAGDVLVSGSLDALAVHNATGGGRVQVSGTSATPLSASLNDVCDYSLIAPALGNVKVNRWVNTDAAVDVIRGGSLGSLMVRGSFQADVEAETIERLSVGGSLTESDVIVASRIGSVRAGALLDSRILIGLTGRSTPDALTDFAAGPSSVGSVTVFGTAPGVFRNSVIAARDVGTVLTGRVGATNGGTPFGVFADRIGAVGGGSEETGGFVYRNLDAPGTARSEIDFRIQTF